MTDAFHIALILNLDEATAQPLPWLPCTPYTETHDFFLDFFVRILFWRLFSPLLQNHEAGGNTSCRDSHLRIWSDLENHDRKGHMDCINHKKSFPKWLLNIGNPTNINKTELPKKAFFLYLSESFQFLVTLEASDERANGKIHVGNCTTGRTTNLSTF